MIVPNPKISKLLWWSVFIGATFTLSNWLYWFKTFTMQPVLANGLSLAGITLALALQVAVLVYDGYTNEKAKGNVMNTFGPFERLYAWQTTVRPPANHPHHEDLK